METPSSSRRVTRSQTLAASSNIPNSRKKDESETMTCRSRKEKSERSALFDITNDSPIVGVARGNLKTPCSVAKNNGGRGKRTPGSGEALLRGQVTTLLQKVEEDLELSKFSLDVPSFPTFLQGLSDSPSGILAPTPANTPLVSNPANAGDDILPAEEDSDITEAVDSIDGAQQETGESEESTITRALKFDSPGKCEDPGSGSSSTISSIFSALTHEASQQKGVVEEDDDASVWSVQANASWKEEENEEGEEEEGGLIDELCEGLRLISFEEKKGLQEFEGRHTWFIYDSDGEMVGEEVVVGPPPPLSPSILQLKGMPVPEGKHLRFPEDDEGQDVGLCLS